MWVLEVVYLGFGAVVAAAAAAAEEGLGPSLPSSFAADAAVGAVADVGRRAGRVGDLGRGLLKACLDGAVVMGAFDAAVVAEAGFRVLVDVSGFDDRDSGAFVFVGGFSVTFSGALVGAFFPAG